MVDDLKYVCPCCETGEFVEEDRSHAEVYCSKCGLVLASAPPYLADTIGTKYHYPYGFLI